MNWKQFHKDLDLAMATMIEEENILPSRTSLMDFAEFSNLKRQTEESTKSGRSANNGNKN